MTLYNFFRFDQSNKPKQWYKGYNINKILLQIYFIMNIFYITETAKILLFMKRVKNHLHGAQMLYIK